MEALLNLKSVLCDPEGCVCISGSNEDTHIIQSSLTAIEKTIEKQAAQIEMMRQAIQALENDSEECLDFDECTAVLVPIDTFHALIGPMVLSPDQALEQFAAKVREQCFDALDPDKYPNECDKSMVYHCKLAIRAINELP